MKADFGPTRGGLNGLAWRAGIRTKKTMYRHALNETMKTRGNAGLRLLMALACGLTAISPLARAQDEQPAAKGSISAKLWVVSLAEAENAVFPAPAATPDATFTTNGIGYVGQTAVSGKDPARNCYTIGTFVGHCGMIALGLTFSGLPNANLGGTAASSATVMSSDVYGVMIEFTGTVKLTNGQEIGIIHDDGVSLNIDGNPVSGFTTGITAAYLQLATFTGTTRSHSFDLLYANAEPQEAWVVFSPQLF